MIGTLDRKIIISVPSKCGYRGLLNCLVSRLKVAEEIKPHHGWEPHSDYLTRVLILREPLERWVSLYWFIKNVNWKSNAWNKYRPSLISFYRFSELVSSFNGKMLMMQPLHRYQEFNPHKILMQETIVTQWKEAIPIEWLDSYNLVSKHATKGKLSVDETLSSEGFHSSFLELLHKEYESFGGIYDLQARSTILSTN